MLHKGIVTSIFILLTLAARAGWGQETQGQSPSGSRYAPQILESSADKLVIRVDVPPLQVLRAGMTGSEAQMAALGGYSLSAEPGKPQVPVKGFHIGIPADAAPTVQILDQEKEEHVFAEIPPAPGIVYDKTPALEGMSLDPEPKARYVFEKDPQVYERNEFYPGRVVQMAKPAIMRGQHLVSVQIYPIQYNPQTQHITYTRRLTFAVYFARTGRSHTVSTEDSYFEPLYKTTLINYDQAKQWRALPQKSLKKSQGSSSYFLDQSGEWYKILTDKPGIFRVDKTALQAAGMNTASIDPRYFRLFNRGVEVAIHVIGEEDGSFDDDDYIEFYADAFKSFYTTTNIYWLAVGSSPGKRMAKVDGEISSSHPVLTRGKNKIHYEKDLWHRADYPGHTDNVAWWHIMIFSPKTETHSIDLGYVSDTLTTDCTFWLKGQGMTETSNYPDHHTVAEINGNQLLDELWDSRVAFSKKVTFPQQWLEPDSNKVSIIGPGDTSSPIDFFFVDFMEIEYWRDYIARNDSLAFGALGEGLHSLHLRGFDGDVPVSIYDITDSSDVKIITNFSRLQDSIRFQYNVTLQHQFLAVSDSAKNAPSHIEKFQNLNLRAPDIQADYLIITHSDFISPATKLADYRADQGYSTLVIPVEAIYDEFNFGFYDAGSIKSFLSYAYNQWQWPAPAFVVLFGDASFNPRILNPQIYGEERSDFVPTRFFEAHEDNFEAASDNWFAFLQGDDVFPEMYVGRLPARTVEQAEGMVDKIIGYEKDVTPGSWYRTATFCADNGEGGVLSFEDSLDAYIDNYVPDDFIIKRIYLRDLGTEGSRTAILNAFEEGTLLVNYYGHGSASGWAAEGIFNKDDVTTLQNGSKAPFVFTLSCINGYFIRPEDKYRCLGEALERKSGGGSVAIFTASGEAYPSPVLALGRSLFSALFDERNTTLGLLTNAGIAGLMAGYPEMWDHAMFYILFGDPATALHYQPAMNFAACGFSGTIHISGEPPQIGSKLLATYSFANSIAASSLLTQPKGRFGPIYIDPDDPDTPIKDGAVQGDSVYFSLVTLKNDTIPLYPAAAWESGRVKQINLSNFKTGIEMADLDIELFVDGRKVGTEIPDGEIISKNAVISARLVAKKNLDLSTVRVRLNGALLDAEAYTILPDQADPQHKARLEFAPGNLPDGPYQLTIEAISSAMLQGQSRKEFSFTIQSELSLADVLNYPNPMQKETDFTFVLRNDTSTEVTLKVFTIAGRLIKSIDTVAQVGYNEIHWDGLDANGDALANGVYLYKVIAVDGDERQERVERLIVMN